MGNVFSPGDRVASNVAGYYMGLPGRIISPNQIQYDYHRYYLIELDIGKRIALPTHHIKKLDTEQEGKENDDIHI